MYFATYVQNSLGTDNYLLEIRIFLIPCLIYVVFTPNTSNLVFSRIGKFVGHDLEIWPKSYSSCLKDQIADSQKLSHSLRLRYVFKSTKFL